MVHLGSWESKQPRECLLACLCSHFWNVLSRYLLVLVCSRRFYFKKKIMLFISCVLETLCWRITVMNGFRVLLRSNLSMLLLLALLHFQSLGLDVDSRSAAEVCATHTISPGPKGEEETSNLIQYMDLFPRLKATLAAVWLLSPSFWVSSDFLSIFQISRLLVISYRLPWIVS